MNYMSIGNSMRHSSIIWRQVSRSITTFIMLMLYLKFYNLFHLGVGSKGNLKFEVFGNTWLWLCKPRGSLSLSIEKGLQSFFRYLLMKYSTSCILVRKCTDITLFNVDCPMSFIFLNVKDWVTRFTYQIGA